MMRDLVLTQKVFTVCLGSEEIVMHTNIQDLKGRSHQFKLQRKGSVDAGTRAGLNKEKERDVTFLLDGREPSHGAYLT